ncbi:MAG: hypothetical protein Q7K65_04150 [Candidatus Buchananbacteria bacterium]|nr:hypothetical protein [Candidatus Buchananbacteria bacterium]
MIGKIRKIIIYLVRNFFIRTNSIRICRYLGLFLYKLGQVFAVARLKKIPGVESIYSMTDLTSWTFLPGESDIDLVLVVKNFNSQEFINFAEQFSHATKTIYYFFPFFQHMPVYTDEVLEAANESWSLEATQKTKDFRNWILLWGQDRISKSTPPDHQEPSPVIVRLIYERLFLEICRFKWEPKRQLRRIYLNFFDIMRQSFIAVKKRDARSDDEYVSYMREIGLRPEFIDLFLKLPDCHFRRDYEFLPLALFSALKLLENIKEPVKHDLSHPKIVVDKKIEITLAEEAVEFVNQIDKVGISSIYCGQYIHCLFGFQNLYFILENDLPYDIFRKEFDNIYNKLNILKTLRANSTLGTLKAVKHNGQDPKEVFPLIMTKRMMESLYLINGQWGLEGLEIGLFGKKIFGKDIDFLSFWNGNYDDGLTKIEYHSLATFMITLYQIALNKKNRATAFGLIKKTVKFYQLYEKTNTIYYGDIDRRYRENFGHDGPAIDNMAEFMKAIEIFYRHEKKRISHLLSEKEIK